jgi:hypothetical protein
MILITIQVTDFIEEIFFSMVSKDFIGFDVDLTLGEIKSSRFGNELVFHRFLTDFGE